MRFSVVMPIHNEEEFLPYSLPSIFHIKPDEVILIFDRCTDSSIEIAKKITEKLGYLKKTKIIELNDPSPEWKFRVAFLRRYCFKMAKNDVILNIDADTLLDEKIIEYLPLIGKNEIALITFSRTHCPLIFQDFINKLVSTIPKIGARALRAGTYAFSKKAWLKTENQDAVKKIVRAEDTHLHLSISKKYKTIFAKTKTIHLRPEEKGNRDYIRGVTRWTVKHDSMLMTMVNSLVYLRPLILVGYLHARLHGSTNAKKRKVIKKSFFQLK
jgi:glycosyltransferase involved in cell wall biosynthesis